MSLRWCHPSVLVTQQAHMKLVDFSCTYERVMTSMTADDSGQRRVRGPGESNDSSHQYRLEQSLHSPRGPRLLVLLLNTRQCSAPQLTCAPPPKKPTNNVFRPLPIFGSARALVS